MRAIDFELRINCVVRISDATSSSISAPRSSSRAEAGSRENQEVETQWRQQQIWIVVRYSLKDVHGSITVMELLFNEP